MATVSTVNAIPKMTSNTAPSGIANASGFNASGQDPWKAFDSLANTTWRSKNGDPLPQWLTYEFTSPIIISAYKVTVGSTFSYTPKSWTFEGSNDGSNWTILDTRSNITNWTSSKLFELFNFTNMTAYKAYRINITENNGGTFTDIYELEMYELIFDNKFLILTESGEGYSLAFANEDVSIVPFMTYDNTPFGNVTVSKVSGTNYGWKAFDGILTGNGWISDAITNQWLAYKSTQKKRVSKYALICNYGVNDASPRNWELQGSNDELTWITLDNQSNITDWVFQQKKEFTVDPSKVDSYLVYRIFIYDNNGSTTYLSIGEFLLYESWASQYIITDPTEDDYVEEGMKINTSIDFNKIIIDKIYVQKKQTLIGSGKVFKQTIDTTRVPIKKVTIE